MSLQLSAEKPQTERVGGREEKAKPKQHSDALEFPSNLRVLGDVSICVTAAVKPSHHGLVVVPQVRLVGPVHIKEPPPHDKHRLLPRHALVNLVDLPVHGLHS